jgi:hypothetical protein
VLFYKHASINNTTLIIN